MIDHSLTQQRTAARPSMGLFNFMALDADGSPAVPPDTTMGVDLWAPGLGRLLSRTDWSMDARWFTFKCAGAPDSTLSGVNAFDFYRKGEWLTKRRPGSTSSPPIDNSLMFGQRTRRGAAATAAAAFGSDYAYALGMSACHSRSILWIKPDLIICYDRVDGEPASFVLNMPTIVGVENGLVSARTAGGQNLFLHTVLPIDADVSTHRDHAPEPDEPMRARVEVAGASRFLNVIEASDRGYAPSSVEQLASSSGDLFEGVQVGRSAVYFRSNLSGKSSGTSFIVPDRVDRIFIAGLAARTGYAVVRTHRLLTVRPGGDVRTDDAGLLAL